MNTLKKLAIVALINMTPLFGMHEFTEEEKAALFATRLPVTTAQGTGEAPSTGEHAKESDRDLDEVLLMQKGFIKEAFDKLVETMKLLNREDRLLQGRDIRGQHVHVYVDKRHVASVPTAEKRTEWVYSPSSRSNVGVSKTESERIPSQEEIDAGKRIDALLAETKRNLVLSQEEIERGKRIDALNAEITRNTERIAALKQQESSK